MRKQLLMAGASALAIALAGPALAEDDSGAQYTANGGSSTVFDNWSESFQDMRNNVISNSFNQGQAGVGVAQQNNGSNNSIGGGNAIMANGANVAAPFQSGAEVNSLVEANYTDSEGKPDPVDPGQPEIIDPKTQQVIQPFIAPTLKVTNDRDNLIDNGTGNDFAGSLGVQQNNGDANEIQFGNSVQSTAGMQDGDVHKQSAAMAETIGSGMAYNNGSGGGGEWELNTVSTKSLWAGNTITGSFQNGSGLLNVQQNNGDQNAIAAFNAVSTYETLWGNLTNKADVTAASSAYDIWSYADQRNNLIGGESFQNFAGLANVVQNNGVANGIGQGNNVDYAATYKMDVDSYYDVNVTAAWIVAHDDDGVRNNTITGSLNGTSGLHNVAQNNGSGNGIGQLNGVTAHGSNTIGGALNSDVDVIGVVENVDVSTLNAVRDNTITGSFIGTSGLGNTAQNNGDGNVIGQANGVTAGIGGPAFSAAGGSTNATLSAAVSGNSVSGSGNDMYTNTISGSYQGGGGVFNVAQNNGSGNAILASNNVTTTVVGGSLSVPNNLPAGFGGVVNP